MPTKIRLQSEEKDFYKIFKDTKNRDDTLIVGEIFEPYNEPIRTAKDSVSVIFCVL